MIYTDNPDFYPTPRTLFDQLTGRDRIFGRVLEPSAGKGDMIAHIKDRLRYGNRDGLRIDAIENDPRLVDMLMSEGISVVWDDFLTYQTYKEYDYIVMNPPFSNGVDHVLKALDLAENQITRCEIYAILNKQTLDNAYSTKRQELLRKLEAHAAEIRYVSGAFEQAERRTDVEVALIHVKIEKDAGGRSIYDKIPLFTADRTAETEEMIGTALSTYVKPTELHERLNDIERLVAEYETACDLARETYEAVRLKQSFYSYIDMVNRRQGSYSSPLSYIVPNGKDHGPELLAEEIDRLRSGYWELILGTDEVRKMLTADSREKLNRQIEAAGGMEINLVNIRTLLMALEANQRDMLVESIASIFRKITDRHMTSYSSNVHYYNGWKTNSSYKLNRKIIIPIQYSAFDSWDFKDEYERLGFGVRDWIDDIVKALQLIDPAVTNEFTAIEPGEFENEWLRFKMFRKGTVHVWFKDERLLARLNYICGKHFGWLPSDEEMRTDAKAREWVAREFAEMGDISEVRLLREEF